MGGPEFARQYVPLFCACGRVTAHVLDDQGALAAACPTADHLARAAAPHFTYGKRANMWRCSPQLSA